MSENDKFLLETLGKFCVRARHSSWETLTHTNDIEAVDLLNQMSGYLAPSEYRALMTGWGTVRITNDDAGLTSAVEAITHRLQERVESF